MDVPMTEVELSVSCKNLRDRDALSKSDPICALSVAEFGSQKFEETDRTERIQNCHDPEFAHKFRINYYFEEKQRLRFELYDIDSDQKKLSKHDFLGGVEISLGEIVGGFESKVNRPLTYEGKHGGLIEIRAEEVGKGNEVVFMHLRGKKLDKKDFIGKSDPYILIYRLGDDGSRTLAYRSEVVDNSLNPSWKTFKVSMRALCSNDPNRNFLIECFDHDDHDEHDLIGQCNLTIAQMAGNIGALYDLINAKKQAKKKSYKNSGQLEVLQCEVRKEHSFLEYIQGGTQVHFSVAVDFTGSNGDPRRPESLHFIGQNLAASPNQYMIALRSVGEIIEDYDSDKQFPALGFGAKLPNGQVSHEFFLNFHPSNPHCQGVDGIIQAYVNAIHNCQLYGPTNFSPVINHVARIASNCPGIREGLHYFVLLIITDGIISDIEATIASIVGCSSLPMSIIIVGVGNEEFDEMEVLDADKGRLSFQGRYAERDIVQFVPLRKFLHNEFSMSQAKLAKAVLKEVPTQLIGWMQARNIEPPKGFFPQTQQQ